MKKNKKDSPSPKATSKREKVKKQSHRYREFDELLHEKLQDPTLVLLYLNEAIADEDKRVFLFALKHVLIAQGGDMNAVAKQAKLNRNNLSRMLSPASAGLWKNFGSLFDTLGLQVHFSLKNK